MEPLFPKVKASQERIYRMAERLSRDHTVDVATTVRDPDELEQSRAHLRAVCRAFHPITPINPHGSQLQRKLRRAEYLLLHAPRHHPHHYFYGGHPRVTAQVADIVRRNRYDIVQAEYWYMARVFDAIDAGIFKAIDTLDVLFDKVRQEMARRHGDRLPARQRRAQAKYRSLEIAHLELADLVISISAADHETFIDLGLGAKTLLVPIGQDLDHFRAREPAGRKDDVVLFYGNMGRPRQHRRLLQAVAGHLSAHQARRAGRATARRRRQSAGLDTAPRRRARGHRHRIRRRRPRPSGPGKVAVIPLEVAAGFRGRVVELMAMEIPVLGTHRALDCVQMEPGVHGFVTDSDVEMADHAARLLLDDDARAAMGAECRALAMARYSIDATIGKLSDYYLDLPRRRDRQGSPSSR